MIRLQRSAEDPHKVALGAAIGMWINFVPLPGFGAMLALLIAWLLRGNLAAAFIVQMIGNPSTMPLIWWISYRLGKIVIPGMPEGQHLKQLMANMNPAYVMEHAQVLMHTVMLPLWVGGQILGLILGALTYWLLHWEVKRFWEARRARRKELHG